jgi:3-methyladenine DNA glycosylase AlkD
MPNLTHSGSAASIRAELKAVSDPEKARILSRFFKTGPGEYGAGDKFLGVVAPKVRKIVKANRATSLGEVRRLIRSPFHEERLTALLILVEKFQRGDGAQKKEIYELYLASTAYINNWDLVDLTAQHIVGAYLTDKDTAILTRLALSESLWERRIAMLATFYFIRAGESCEALRIAGLLMKDKHDLIHKAVGWMLREVGKRCSMELECRFLDAHAAGMPRTMLRYAIERFPDELRRHYLRRTAEKPGK